MLTLVRSGTSPTWELVADVIVAAPVDQSRPLLESPRVGRHESRLMLLTAPLAETILAARIAQTLVHVALRQTNAVVSACFTLFSIQPFCKFAMGAAAAAVIDALSVCGWADDGSLLA